MSSVDVKINNSKKETLGTETNLNKIEIKNIENTRIPIKKYMSSKQLLIIIIPITTVLLFAVIFIPIYIVSKNKNNKNIENKNNNNNIFDEYDEYEKNIVNLTYAILTPKDGFDNVFIYLGGIGEISFNNFNFFESKNTFVPKGTKIYFLSGTFRNMQYMSDYNFPITYVPGWFNVDSMGNLVPPNDFTEAKKSLNIILDEIDRIKKDDGIDYKNIFIGGFSQGAIMTNYVLLNSRYELGGYIAFSGYVFDHDLEANKVVYNLNPAQKAKIDLRKDYYILATHSFYDNKVFYKNATESYQEYYKQYSHFKLLSFGKLGHEFSEQPIHPDVREWLKKRMNK